MDLQEAVFDKEVFREELRTQKLKVAMMEEQNLETSKIRHELKDNKIMVHVEVDETQKFGMQLQNIQGCHERLWVNRDDLAKELEKDKHDRKKPSETWTRFQEFGDVEDLLTFRRPNPCYIPTLDATIVSCHLFDVFPTTTNKNLSFQNFCLYCVYPSLSLLSHPKPMDPIEDEWRWAYIVWTNESIGDGPMDSKHGGSHGE